MQSSDQRVVGQTKDAGFQIGARKTFATSPEQAWNVIISNEGIRLWMGDVTELHWAKGEQYRTSDGTIGEVRVVSPGSHVRLTWHPRDWTDAATIQVRVIPSDTKTMISFHQERLPDAHAREQMRQRWQNVEALEPLLNRCE